MEMNWVQLTEIRKETKLDYSSADSMVMQTVDLLDSWMEITNQTDYNLELRWVMY